MIHAALIALAAFVLAGAGLAPHADHLRVAQPEQWGGDADQPEIQDPRPPTRFVTVNIYVDADSPLGAYQLEFVGAESVALAGIYGGESGAFADPPRYDPRAISGLEGERRVILAAYSTETENLPTGETLVARLALMTDARIDPTWTLKPIAAANADGERINITARAELVEPSQTEDD